MGLFTVICSSSSRCLVTRVPRHQGPRVRHAKPFCITMVTGLGSENPYAETCSLPTLWLLLAHLVLLLAVSKNVTFLDISGPSFRNLFSVGALL